MSAALQRLIGRATGDVIGGLRPRLPSLFETGSGESGLREVYAEVPATAATWPSAKPTPDEDQPAPRQAIAVAAPPEPLQPPASPVDLETEPPAVPDPAAQPPELDVAQAVTSPAVASAAPAPLLPRADAAENEPTVQPPLETVRASEGVVREAIFASGAPPTPLLTPEPKPRVAEAMPDAMPRRELSRRVERQSVPASTSDQDVVIQIGRLDIRADPPKPVRTPRPAERPSLPLLSDYLRRGRP